MRLRILVPLMTLLVLAPTGAGAAEEDLLICDAPPANTTVIGPNAGLTPEVASPQFSARQVTGTWSYVEIQYQLDLYPAKATDSATVSSSLDWEIPANDWDYFLLDGNRDEISASEDLQPLDPPHEAVSGTVKHCGLFRISIVNYNAIGGAAVDEVDPLQISLSTGSVK